MKRTVIGCLLATVAIFIWGAVFWMSPLPYSVVGKVSDDAAVGKSLLQLFPATGTYFLPGQYNGPEKCAELAKAGPIATVYIQREGSEMMPAKMFIEGFVHELAVVILIAWLLNKALPGLGGYCARVTFVTVAGLAPGIFAGLGPCIWMFYPLPFQLVTTIYHVTTWLVAGLVLAAFIKPKAAAPAQATQS